MINVEKPASATLTQENGSDPMNQPSEALVSLPITESQAAKIGLLERWQVARKKVVTRLQRKQDAEVRLKSVVEGLLERAEAERWSQRSLARRSGLSWSGWLRCRNSAVNARTWLPKLEAALKRLKPS